MSLVTGLSGEDCEELSVSWESPADCQMSAQALIMLSRQFDVRIFISLTLNLAGVKTGPEWRVGGDQVRQSRVTRSEG